MAHEDIQPQQARQSRHAPSTRRRKSRHLEDEAWQDAPPPHALQLAENALKHAVQEDLGQVGKGERRRVCSELRAQERLSFGEKEEW